MHLYSKYSIVSIYHTLKLKIGFQSLQAGNYKTYNSVLQAKYFFKRKYVLLHSIELSEKSHTKGRVKDIAINARVAPCTYATRVLVASKRITLYTATWHRWNTTTWRNWRGTWLYTLVFFWYLHILSNIKYQVLSGLHIVLSFASRQSHSTRINKKNDFLGCVFLIQFNILLTVTIYRQNQRMWALIHDCQ